MLDDTLTMVEFEQLLIGYGELKSGHMIVKWKFLLDELSLGSVFQLTGTGSVV